MLIYKNIIQGYEEKQVLIYQFICYKIYISCPWSLDMYERNTGKPYPENFMKDFNRTMTP